jgi:hypothetical protein
MTNGFDATATSREAVLVRGNIHLKESVQVSEGD